MIVLDNPHDFRSSPKAQLASSSRAVEEYVDDTVPYTDQLEEAMSSDIDSLSLVGSSAPSLSSESPAPLPPSYEASLGSQTLVYKSSKRARRRYLVPAAFICLYLIIATAAFAPLIFKKHPPKPKKGRGPEWAPAFLPAADVDPSSVLPPLATGTPSIFSIPEYKTGRECKTWYGDAKEEKSSSANNVTYYFPIKQFVAMTQKMPRQTGTAGAISVVVNDDPREGRALVEVHASFYGDKCKKEADFCIDRTPEGTVLSVNVRGDKPKDPKGWSPVFFNVTLRLPRIPNLHVYNFSTHLNFFEHVFGDLSGVTFDTFDIRGDFSPFSAKNLTARSLRVKTTHKAISGRMNASEVLMLSTSQAPITTELILCPKEGSPVKFAMATSDSPINATIHLDQIPSAERPRYSGMATTSNAGIEVVALHSDAVSESILDFMAETSLEPVKLVLDSRYEGGFYVKTKAATAKVVGPKSTADPRGLGRKHVVTIDERSAWGASGWIGWMERPKNFAGRSHVEISSELADATLILSA